MSVKTIPSRAVHTHTYHTNDRYFIPLVLLSVGAKLGGGKGFGSQELYRFGEGMIYEFGRHPYLPHNPGVNNLGY